VLRTKIPGKRGKKKKRLWLFKITRVDTKSGKKIFANRGKKNYGDQKRRNKNWGVGVTLDGVENPSL